MNCKTEFFIYVLLFLLFGVVLRFFKAEGSFKAMSDGRYSRCWDLQAAFSHPTCWSVWLKTGRTTAMTQPSPVLKNELAGRLTLVTALVGLVIVIALTFWQLRPRTVGDAIGPIPLDFGDPTSPKQVVAFLSPTCPHCAQFELGVGKDFYARAEAGEFYYAVYPLMLEDDREAYTLAFFCAHEQDALPVFALLHYQNYYLGQNLGLTDLAERAEMDPAIFGRCLEAPATQREMQSSLRWMETLNVLGTPTFFVRNRSSDPYRRVRGNRDEGFWNSWLDSD